MATRHFTSKLSKKIKVLLGFIISYGSLWVVFSCVETDLWVEGCPLPTEADALGLKQVFYSPYSDQRYATEQDTVNLRDFRFNFELEIKEKEMGYRFHLPGTAFALSCIPSYTIRNISNLTVILTAPFAGLPIGTDISYLLETLEKEKLSSLRKFEGVSVYFGTKLTLTPENFSQLKTRTFLFLKDGTYTFIDSTSPYLKTD